MLERANLQYEIASFQEKRDSYAVFIDTLSSTIIFLNDSVNRLYSQANNYKVRLSNKEAQVKGLIARIEHLEDEYSKQLGKDLKQLVDETQAFNTLPKIDFFNIMPNPSDGSIDILLAGKNISDSISIKFYNQAGKIVFQQKYKAAQTIKAKIDLSPGLYMVSLNDSLNRSMVIMN